MLFRSERERERERERDVDAEIRTDWGALSQKDTGRTTSGNSPKGSPRIVRAGETERLIVDMKKDTDDDDDDDDDRINISVIEVYGIGDGDRARGSEKESIELCRLMLPSSRYSLL